MLAALGHFCEFHGPTLVMVTQGDPVYTNEKIIDNFSAELTTGPTYRSVLLMFTSMRNVVTKRAILPGTISTGITNPMNEASVSNPVGRYVFM